MKLNMDDDNVEHVSMTVEQARDDELNLNDWLAEALDRAQAHVFGGEHEVAYLVIEITK
jgi:hypothetical protein